MAGNSTRGVASAPQLPAIPATPARQPLAEWRPLRTLRPHMRLVLRASDGSTRSWDLTGVPLPLVIGRDADLAHVAIVDGQISRVHCRILRQGGEWVLEDLSSRNGTTLNGERVATARLVAGDRFRIGSSQFSLDDAAAPQDPLIGSRIMGYAIEDGIGRGRFGAVYRGTQIALGRPVAIKVLTSELARDPERVKAFLTEARRAGALNHPNLVQVHDVITAPNDIYLLVMELMAGSVGDLLRDSGPMAEAAVRKILADISAALAFAEANRLVHRDVKPDNILFGEDGTYKLADLGIAAHISADGQARQERIFGSPHYVAPEQARGGTIDGRADLYALGATAFHLLSGRPPFEGQVREIIQAHLGKPPPDLKALQPQLSVGICQLVAKLMKKLPAERPKGAGEVVAMLDRLSEGKALVRPPVRRRVHRYRP